jgi:hypothetical protein
LKRDTIDVPSECTIVKTMGRIAYRLKTQGAVQRYDEGKTQSSHSSTTHPSSTSLCTPEPISTVPPPLLPPIITAEPRNATSDREFEGKSIAAKDNIAVAGVRYTNGTGF